MLTKGSAACESRWIGVLNAFDLKFMKVKPVGSTNNCQSSSWRDTCVSITVSSFTYEDVADKGRLNIFWPIRSIGIAS